MKLNQTTREYISEYAERVAKIPAEAKMIADHKSYQVGRVYYTIGADLYIANHTGSDVSDWATICYKLLDAEDASPSNAEIIAMLNAETPVYKFPGLYAKTCKVCKQSEFDGAMFTNGGGDICDDCF